MRRTGGGGLALRIERLSVRLAGEARPVLRSVDLEVEPGEAVGICGRSGTGKSTLLHAVAGLVPWLRPAEVRGDVLLGSEVLSDLDPGQRSRLLATCLDRPDAQLFLPTVEQEVDAAVRLHGDPAPFDFAIRALDVGPLLGRRTTELSSGERQRVALAVTLGASPRPVLLDEPTAHLDEQGATRLAALLAEIHAAGGSVLVAEQAGWRLRDGITRWLEIADRSLTSRARPAVAGFPRPVFPALERPVLEAAGLEIERGGTRLLAGADFALNAGEVVLLSGANGAGKSTLARVLAGLRRPVAGSLRRSGRVAFMLPSAELQLFAGSVAAEVTMSGVTREESARVLRRHRLDHLAARSPWTLSRGERQRLVHAALDLHRPSLMIVDEPGQGLDPEDLADFVGLVHRRAEKGRTYLVISHRLELAGAVHRHLRIDKGRLFEVPL